MFASTVGGGAMALMLEDNPHIVTSKPGRPAGLRVAGRTVPAKQHPRAVAAFGVAVRTPLPGKARSRI